ncbi:hypothetical protein Pla86_20490 [Planctomycetes bacterium Pla86]|uniref:FG-GAP repeat protein n=2 Tax=Engelhardtia mirabilis TaxID=2528011 RepID=A0A518BJ50_9BACT|nr:hypothetical protein Pla133_20490 [Planctomycetes bacterium Pla133]QDV01300.1 hypothetical protein Pla86_20490 [Planctomycetes bacterium Pla86]
MAQCHRQSVVDPQAAGGDRFGTAVALHGDRAAVSASRSAFDPLGPGRIFVYQRVAGGEWLPAGFLDAPAGEEVLLFGQAIALGGDFLVASGYAPQIPGATGTNGLFVHAWNGSEFSFVQKLETEQPISSAQGGIVVADGDRIAVGFPDGSPKGFVKVFARQGGLWSLEQSLGAPHSLDVFDFGIGLDLDGDELVVSARRNFALHYQRGASGTWDLTQTIELERCYEAELAGDVQLVGDDVLAVVRAGGPIDDNCFSRVEVYRRPAPGQPFAAIQSILQPAATLDQAFGMEMAADGERMAIGSWEPDFIAAVPNGDVWVYARENGVWGPVGSVGPPWPANNYTGIGTVLAASGDTLLTGAMEDNTVDFQAGSASFWSLTGAGCPSLSAHPPVSSIDYMNGVPSYAPARRQDLVLDAGPSHGLELYLLLGSLSGTSPGVAVDGLLLPLVADSWFAQTLGAPNQPPMEHSFGALDAQGRALAAIQVPAPLDQSFAGVEFHHAFVTIASAPALAVTGVSEGVAFTLVP